MGVLEDIHALKDDMASTERRIRNLEARDSNRKARIRALREQNNDVEAGN